MCTRKEIVTHNVLHTSAHTLAKCVCRELAKMSSYVHGCLLSLPLSLFHSSTWWWQREQLTHSLDHRSSLGHHVPLACQPNSGMLNFSLKWWYSRPWQSLVDFRLSIEAKEHNEWKAPSQNDFNQNQPLYSIISRCCHWGTLTSQEEEPEQGEKVRRGGNERKKEMDGAECKWLHPCMVAEQVAQW